MRCHPDGVHVLVDKGDTWSSVARELGIDKAELQAVNGVTAKNFTALSAHQVIHRPF